MTPHDAHRCSVTSPSQPPTTDAPAVPARRLPAALRIVAGVFGVAVGLVALEGLVSLGLLAWDVAMLRPPPIENFRQAAYDSLVGWVSIPNLANRDNFGPGRALTTNADGIRIHRPVARAAAPGERRVICSGASFTFGSGVGDGDTFCALLEQYLPGVHTINMAQRGYGIDQSYLLYRRDGARYAHDAHLFVVNGSDLDRTPSTTLTGYPKPVLRLRDGHLVAENVPVPRWAGWSRWADAKSLLPRLRMVQLLTRRRNTSELAQYRRVDAQLWPLVDSLFTDLRRLAASRGSTSMVVYLPGMTEYSPNPLDERRARIARSARTAGLTFIDLTDDLRAVPADSLDWMFLTPNATPVRGAALHYTATGHRWVAERLAMHLRATPLLAASGASPRQLVSRGVSR